MPSLLPVSDIPKTSVRQSIHCTAWLFKNMVSLHGDGSGWIDVNVVVQHQASHRALTEQRTFGTSLCNIILQFARMITTTVNSTVTGLLKQTMEIA